MHARRDHGMPALTAVVMLAAPAMAQPVDLRGTVISDAGQPIEHATVILSTARPKVGVPILCPSCYTDCGRSATTGPDGSFTIPAVDGSLDFRLLALGQGWSPLYTDHLDPASPATIMLSPRPPLPDDPARVLRGRVVNEQGNPIQDAMVQPRMYMYRVPELDGRRRGRSSLDNSETLAVTDEQGRFTLVVGQPVESMEVIVSASVMAPVRQGELLLDGTEHTITLGPGATVSGRLLDASGQPLPSRRIGVCGTDRNAMKFMGDFWIGTDDQGRFSLPNLPPNREGYVLYTDLAESHLGGVLGAVPFKASAHGDAIDLGDLATTPGITLRGRVRTSNGAAVPDGARVMLAGYLAWTQRIVDLSSDGTFEFPGIAPGAYFLNVKAPGFHISRSNPSADQLNSSPSLIGKIESDTHITVVLDPGDSAPQVRPPQLHELPMRSIDRVPSP